MALPLISRDEVIGALTVQSTERGAFSAEDITLLQTMADQLANAIENTRLFTQTQNALWETEILYRVFQELLSARDEETVYQLAIEAVAQSGIDSASIYIYVNNSETSLTEQILEQKAVWNASGDLPPTYNTRFKASDMIIEDLIPQHGALIIEDTTANDPRLTDQLRRELILRDVKSLAAFPLSTYQSRLGFLLVTYKTQGKVFTTQQIRFYNTIAQQMIVALENLRLLDASQRRARREEIIREITSKIRGSTNVEDILKTTVTELSKILGTSQGNVTLGVNSPNRLAELQADSAGQKRYSNESGRGKNKSDMVSNTESKHHGQ
jgi:GAF domain-containing protein